jgi:hypothetical protein
MINEVVALAFKAIMGCCLEADYKVPLGAPEEFVALSWEAKDVTLVCKSAWTHLDRTRYIV